MCSPNKEFKRSEIKYKCKGCFYVKDNKLFSKIRSSRIVLEDGPKVVCLCH